jgi:putative endonuclease
MSDAWVYMLRCRDGSLYTGWSTDVAARLARHRTGKASRYTASRLPVDLVFARPMADRTAARREEARIKALDRPGRLALIAANPEWDRRESGVGSPRIRSGNPANPVPNVPESGFES